MKFFITILLNIIIFLKVSRIKFKWNNSKAKKRDKLNYGVTNIVTIYLFILNKNTSHTLSNIIVTLNFYYFVYYIFK